MDYVPLAKVHAVRYNPPPDAEDSPHRPTAEPIVSSQRPEAPARYLVIASFVGAGGCRQRLLRGVACRTGRDQRPGRGGAEEFAPHHANFTRGFDPDADRVAAEHEDLP